MTKSHHRIAPALLILGALSVTLSSASVGGGVTAGAAGSAAGGASNGGSGVVGNNTTGTGPSTAAVGGNNMGGVANNGSGAGLSGATTGGNNVGGGAASNVGNFNTGASPNSATIGESNGGGGAYSSTGNIQNNAAGTGPGTVPGISGGTEGTQSAIASGTSQRPVYPQASAVGGVYGVYSTRLSEVDRRIDDNVRKQRYTAEEAATHRAALASLRGRYRNRKGRVRRLSAAQRAHLDADIMEQEKSVR